MAKIPVYASQDELFLGKRIGYVNENFNLDPWDGVRGEDDHRGITRLKDGRYVFIEIPRGVGPSPRAYVISDKEALEEIIKSGNEELLDLIKFKPLKNLLTAQRESVDSEKIVTRTGNSHTVTITKEEMIALDLNVGDKVWVSIFKIK